MNSFSRLTNEKELLTLLREGDEAAFTQLYNLYWKRCFYTAAQKLQNLYEAEEVVQDIFLDLWKRRQELNITICLSSYLAASVKYKVINIISRRYLSSKYLEHAVGATEVSDLSTENYVRLHEITDHITRESSRLPDKCRMVFQLSRNQGFSQKQIAHCLNISEKTVESHLSKALRILRTGLSHLTTFP